ncbi:MAG: hypothetical protein HOW59_26415 [Nonomuraea sp.]|nr:hypothetical protein [Nonomuraea sp.]
MTTKEDPTDWDGAWDATHADFAKVDPVFLDRYDLMTGRHRQKAKYGGELLVGVETGSGKTFQQFFQSSIDGDPKGIVLLDLRTIP